MEEKEIKQDKPFTPFQYEYINGHYVRKEVFDESICDIKQEIAVARALSEENTKNLKMILGGLKWVGGTAGVLVVSQLFDFFINLTK